MTIIAKTTEGREFMYSSRSAHAVPKASARKICDICNEYKYRIEDGEKWHIYEIDEYDKANYFASIQHGRVYRGVVKMYSPCM